MSQQEKSDAERSAWWGIATISLIAIGTLGLSAQMLSPSVTEVLIWSLLIPIFVAGGILLGLLAMQVFGSSQTWGLTEDFAQSVSQTKTISAQTPQVNVLEKHLSEQFAKPEEHFEEEVDPFYEILKRHHSPGKAA